VVSTSAWLEVNSLRKQAHKEPSAVHAESPGLPATAATYSAAANAVPAFPAFNDPFASHTPAFAPAHAKAAAAAAGAGDGSTAVVSDGFDAPAVEVPTFGPQTSYAETSLPEASQAEASYTETSQAETSHPMAAASESALTPWPSEFQSAVAEMESELAAPLQAGDSEAVAAVQAEPAPSLSPEDQDIHRKAQRFARLLVDEIKLYNQAKVAEGRENSDLYDRLREVIEKSRATYQKRYGNTVAASANYFEHEIIRSLAEDDLSIMGANFRQ
jgi:hypothetical protein